jgi:hypothetical protein
MLTRQALYYCLSHAPSPFCFHYFWDRVSLYAWAGLNRDLPIYASIVDGITGMCHHIQLLNEMASC